VYLLGHTQEPASRQEVAMKEILSAILRRCAAALAPRFVTIPSGSKDSCAG
jgi:hypothetical protein